MNVTYVTFNLKNLQSLKEQKIHVHENEIQAEIQKQLKMMLLKF